MTCAPAAFVAPCVVTRPSLAPRDEYAAKLRSVCKLARLTSEERYDELPEQQLVECLGLPFVSHFNSDAIALFGATQALRLTGELITAPFTVPASPQAMHWNKVTRVFGDGEPESLTTSPHIGKTLITSCTVAILGVHLCSTSGDMQGIRRPDRRASKSTFRRCDNVWFARHQALPYR
jgi:dTDP-4-amino-4,6-dideoxygalactose transaminase